MRWKATARTLSPRSNASSAPFNSCLRSFDATKPNSEFRYNQRDGVIKLTLYDGGYDWEFISTDGITRDSGSGTCH